MIRTIADVLKIKVENELEETFILFEDSVRTSTAPLDSLLGKKISSDAATVEPHVIEIESWRDKICKIHALSAACAEHAKSSHFILTGRSATQVDKEAHQRKVAGHWIALRDEMENKIRSIDSRVNLCKKFLGYEQDAYNNGFVARR
jgi:hypothetical protein